MGFLTEHLQSSLRIERIKWLRRAHLRLGRFGERVATRFLINAGYEILCRNFRSGKAELDIVARYDCLLCFTEVKTRRYKPGLRPADAVNAEKRRHLLQGARRYLREIGSPKLQVRFDIIEILVLKGRIFRINYIKNAFHPPN